MQQPWLLLGIPVALHGQHSHASHACPLPLQVLAAFWQSSGAAFRAVAVLQRQPGLWGHITALLEHAGKAGALSLPAPRSGEADDSSAAAAWVDQEAVAVLVAAEASALQIAAAECYTWVAGASSAAGMPAELSAFLAQLPASLVPQLLERYALPLPTGSLLLAAQQAAAAGGLQLLGAALSDEALWRSMAEGACLAPQLAAAAQPLLRAFGSQAAASRMLADHASQIAARNFGSQRSAVAIAQVHCQQALLGKAGGPSVRGGLCFLVCTLHTCPAGPCPCLLAAGAAAGRGAGAGGVRRRVWPCLCL